MRTIKTFMILVCLCFSAWAHAQTTTVTGTVKDEAGELLPGVTVQEKNQQNGAQTDANGRFSIKVASGDAVLIFSYIGFENQEVPVNGQETLDVVLQGNVSQLEEVIVTGYGTEKRGNLSGSIATVSAGKLKDVSTPNVGNMLQGKVAGVDIVSNTGRPGSLPTVRIRGRSSIRSSIEPLWVVDGVIQHGVPNLNPQDVESISVLKDASAAALYGSRGANGVIVVTTRTAKGSGVSTLSANVRSGVSLFNTGGFQIMNAQQLYDYWGNFGNPKSLPGYYTEDLLKTNTDWLDVGSQNALNQDYSLTYVGSTEKAKIYAGGTYYKEEGSVKGYTYDRLSGRFNIDYDISDRLRFSPKISASYTSTDSRQHSIYDMYRNLPWDSPYDADGNIVNAKADGVTWYGRDQNNYLYDLQWNYGKSNTLNLNTSMDFQYQITNDLVFNSTNNITYYHSEGLSYVDPRSNGGLADKGRLGNDMAKRITRFTNQMLTYTRQFDRHYLKVLGAYEYSDYVYNDLGATGKGLVSGGEILDVTSQPMDINGTKNDYAFQSLLLNANYSYDDRYNLQFSFRRDGASRFGKNHKYGNFFSISGSWNIHEEDFFEIPTVDYLRLKAAYGGVGNTPSSLYPQYELYALNVQYNGNPAAVPSSLGNDELTWEKTYDTNLGLEFGLWDRLRGTFEFYNKNTSGLLHFVPLAAVSGYDGYYDNIGAVRNHGLELTLGVDLIRKTDLNWNLDFNIGRNQNEITELYEGRRQIMGNKIVEVGYDIDTWYMREWAGVNPEDGTPQWVYTDPETGEQGLTGNYSQANLRHVGNSTPSFFGGFATALDYKSVYLRANFAFSSGAKVYHAARELFDSDGAYPTYNQMVLADGWSRWTPDNPNATHPQALYGGNNNAHKVSSRYLEDASFLRMRNVTLGYRLPTSLLNRIQLKGAEIYVSGDNLWTLTSFSGLDPESVINGDLSGSGADAFSPYPVPKRVTFGLNVSF